MADMGTLIANVIAATRAASTVIPGLQGVGVALTVGEKLLGILDDIIASDGPDERTQAQMQEARRNLAAAVTAKAEKTADRFD